jgi:hypothetical protein
MSVQIYDPEGLWNDSEYTEVDSQPELVSPDPNQINLLSRHVQLSLLGEEVGV